MCKDIDLPNWDCLTYRAIYIRKLLKDRRVEMYNAVCSPKTDRASELEQANSVYFAGSLHMT